MNDDTVGLFDWARNNEYTGSVCWLFWNKRQSAYDTREALVDVEDFERLKHLSWSIQKVGKNRMPRVIRPVGQYLAREILGNPQGYVVDHANRNHLDDRRRNLRVCSCRENNLNSPGNQRGTSRFKGVAWVEKRRKWVVLVGPKSARYYLGAFDSETDAARAYNAWAKKHFGPFAFLNTI